MRVPVGEFALTLRVALEPSVNIGRLFAPGAFVNPMPGFDQALVPSAFFARTSTS